MADWSDLVGLKLIDAQAKAARYDHDLVVTRVGTQIAGQRVTLRCPTVLVAIDQSGANAIVTAVTGDDQGPETFSTHFQKEDHV